MARSKRPVRPIVATILQLPPEICAIICEEVTVYRRADLLALCRISHLFRDQAQRLIYRNVDLKHCTPQRRRSWCLAVTRNSQLAERVHTLSLGLPSDLSLSSDATKVARALAKCVNLKELSVFDDTEIGMSDRQFTTAHGSIQGWIVNKCPFRLTKCANSYFRNSFLSQLWAAQSDIRVLSIPYCNGPFPCYDDQLPNLVALEVGAAAALPAGRPLERIQLKFPSNRPGFESLSILSQYSLTLTTLHLLWYTISDPGISAMEMFATVARELPALLHFGVAEPEKRDYRLAEDSPLGALQKFTRLETFFFCTRTILLFHVAANDIFLDTPAGAEKFGLAIMDACATVRRAVVGLIADTQPNDRVDCTDPDKTLDVTCTLTRIAGEIQTEGGTHFDFSAVSRLWDP
ncbi:hypothetical protein DFH07DRAFT_325886 [Mycena maculata]|uniref:F-box domain-containing protein n=1 Tax=Mycena maculata TaxID=230809 RepID=A0AAD7KDV0_9AGAR|nr:hypothetical protein DFH07DRAFT_325886 [Mycena maculata]